MTIATGITAVTGLSEVERKGAGTIVFWDLKNDLTSIVEMDRRCEGAGLYKPNKRTPAACLRTALDAVVDGSRMLVRPLSKRGDWVIVRERVNAPRDATEYEVLARVALDAADRVVVTNVAGALTLSEEIRSQYEMHSKAYSRGCITTWLVARAHDLNGVALRPNGGIYYLPVLSVTPWERVVAVCGSAGSIYEIPAMRSEQAMMAITAAITAEATDTFERIRTEVDGDKLGAFALNNRMLECRVVQKKLTLYEQALGCSLASLQKSFDTLELAVIEAALAAEEPKQ